MGGPPAVTVAMAGDGLDGPIAMGMTFTLALSLVGLFAGGAIPSPADLLYPFLLLVVSIGLAVFCAARARPATHGDVLRWDGHNWFWSHQDDEGVCAVHSVMDLQVCMLLRLRTPEGACEWIWLRRKDYVKCWQALRRVLIFDAISAHDPPLVAHRE